MTTPAQYQVLESPGRLSFGGTAYTSAYPHGGTGLGVFTNVRLVYDPLYVDVLAEEYGQIVNRHFTGEHRFELHGELMSYDPDAVSKLFTTTTTDTVSGYPKVTIGGDAGTALDALAFHLVFTPDDTAKAPFVVMPSAVARPRIGLDLALRLRRLWALPCEFMGLQNGSGVVAEIGKAADL